MADLISDARLSRPLDEARDRYEVIVVGSGYGASIAASRLARAGREVAVLERGREIPTGQFPDTLETAIADVQVRVGQSGRRLGRADGLMEVRLNRDISAVVGCGLGGTSLINANVALRPDKKVLQLKRLDPRRLQAEEMRMWPRVFRENPDLLDPYYDRAEAALGAGPCKDGESLPKVKALKQSAEALGIPMVLPNINVTFEEGPNHFGFVQAACTFCGDCCSGCNHGAKNTTTMNYLPDARAFGAEIFTWAEVRTVSRGDGEWRVDLRDPRTGDGRRLWCDLLVLGAGTIGTTEILLRSRAERGLPVSAALGRHFSGNGDVLAFGYNANLNGAKKEGEARDPVHGVGAGRIKPEEATLPQYRPGPTIAGLIDFHPYRRDVREGLVIEEGVMPGALVMGYVAGFFMNEAVSGEPFRFGDTELRLTDARDVGDILRTDPSMLWTSAYDGPVSRTQSFLVMSHDDAGGVIDFANDCAVLTWPGAGKDPAILRDNAILRDAADAIRAEFMPNPLWQDAMGHKIVTVHPIGGCAMADDPDDGVVTADCEVWDPEAGGVHEGLYVCDGSVIPGALGVNPLLTISAITERAVERLAAARGWTIDYDARRPLPPAEAAPAAAPRSLTADAATGFAEALGRIIEGLRHERDLIDAGDFDSANAYFWEGYETLRTWAAEAGVDLPKLGFLHFLVGRKRLRRTVGPVIDQLLPILEEISETVSAGQYAEIVEVLERHMGDFSPDLRFDERMSGHVSAAELDRENIISNPYDIAARAGEKGGDGHAVTGFFSIDIKSLETMTTPTPEEGGTGSRRSDLGGHVDCGLLGGRLEVREGATFDLLREEVEEVECWKMVYAATLDGPEGPFRFLGRKTLKRREGSDYWTDLTRLEVEIRAGEDPEGPLLYRGVMRLSLQDLAEQVSTMASTIEADPFWDGLDILWETVKGLFTWTFAKRLEDHAFRAKIMKVGLLLLARHGHPEFLRSVQMHYLAGFGKVFAMLVFRAYGGILAYLSNFGDLDDRDPKNPKAPRSYRALRLPEPEGDWEPVVPVRGHDGATGEGRLRLTRYRGGGLGPVILAPGFGVAAASFAMDTTETSLAEYLVARGYDVWLFDYRSSPALDASKQPFTIDDLAAQDWPAAVAMVGEATGSEVQILAHCFGSASLLMSLVDGLSGVRSVISSQTSLHPVTSWLNYAKADAHLASLLVKGVPDSIGKLLQDQGIDLLQKDPRTGRWTLATIDMSPPTDIHGQCSKADLGLNALLWSVPFPAEVPCYSPVCHRVFGIFGSSYLHEQLNEATHNALRRVFGEVSTAPFPQLAEMMRRGYVTDATGAKSYVEDPLAIKVPVDFVAGSRNQIFLPETTLRTYQWLKGARAESEGGMFTRHVFPDYGHMDLFIGRNAHVDVFPYLAECLDARRTEAV